MTQTPAAERMSELRELLEKATPGDWKVYEERFPYRDGKNSHVARQIGTAHDDPQLKGPYPIVTMSVGVGLSGEKPRQFVHIDQADAALICAMKNALPELLDTIEQLQSGVRNNQDLLTLAIDAKHQAEDRATQAERALEEIRGQKPVAWRSRFDEQSPWVLSEGEPPATLDREALIPLPAQCAKEEG